MFCQIYSKNNVHHEVFTRLCQILHFSLSFYHKIFKKPATIFRGSSKGFNLQIRGYDQEKFFPMFLRFPIGDKSIKNVFQNDLAKFPWTTKITCADQFLRGRCKGGPQIQNFLESWRSFELIVHGWSTSPSRIRIGRSNLYRAGSISEISWWKSRASFASFTAFYSSLSLKSRYRPAEESYRSDRVAFPRLPLIENL